MSIKKYLACLCVILGLCCTASVAMASETPIWIDEIYARLQPEIDKYAAGGIVGIAVKDLNTGEQLLFNNNVSFPPASVIKIPVMIEAFHQEALGKLSMGEKLVLQQSNKLPGSGSLQYLRNGSVFTVARLIELMITDSDNTATHMLMCRLGVDNINRYMKRLGLKQTYIRDMTLIKKIPGQCNTSSPEDMLTLMDMMYHNQLVSPRASVAMLGIMKKQIHRWGIPRYLPRSVLIANKTGSVDYVRNDVGIIFDPKHPYILAIFSKNLPANHEGSVMVGELSKLVYEKRVLHDVNLDVENGPQPRVNEGG